MKYILGIIVVAIIFSNDSFGCTRFGFGFPIEATFTRSDAAFRGKVTKVKNASKDPYGSNAKILTFSVESKFKGIRGETISVTTPDWRGACGLKARVGETWIIFANLTDDGKTYVTDKGWLHDATEDAAVLLKLEKAASGELPTTISGRLVSYGKETYDFEFPEISLQSGENRWSTKPNPDGTYSFSEIPDGLYRVDIKFPFRGIAEFRTTDSNPIFSDSGAFGITYTVKLKRGDHDYSFFEIFRYTEKK